MQAQAAFGAADGGAATLRQRLLHGHLALDAERPGALDLAVDVEHRGAIHVDGVAAGEDEVGFGLFAQVERRDVDQLAEGLAVAHAGNDGDSVAGDRGAPRGGEHVAHARVEGFKREAARTVDLAEHGDLVAAVLDQDDVDLRLLDEAAGLQRRGDLLLGAADGETADLHRADQRIGNRAAFGHPRIEGEIGILEHQDANRITGAELIVALIVLGLSLGCQGHRNAGG